MKKKWLLIVTLGLALILAVPALTGCGSPAAAQNTIEQLQISQQPQGIWVTGTGEVSVTPDIAVLSLGIVAQETTVAEAQAKASEAMAQVMQALTDSGIARKDIQTGSFSISQRTRWDDMRQTDSITGYRITNMVTVKIRDMEEIGSVIDSAIQAGGDLIRINGINFSVEEPSKYYEEVREKAMDAAKNKAEELAKLAGVTLGTPTYIVENAQYSPVYGGYSNFAMSVPAPMPAMEASSPISAGETKITLSVQVAYSTVP